MPSIIYHNPACATSRNVLLALREAGKAPEVVEYLKVGWTLPLLQSLIRRTGLSARQLLRTRGDLASALGLNDGSTEAEILSAKPPHRHVHDRPENRAKSHLNVVVFPIKASPIVRLPPLPFAPIIRGRIRGLGKWVAKLKA